MEIRKTTHEGILSIGDVELDVAVLSDGTRVITQSAVFKALGRPSRGNARLINTPVFMDAQNLQPFVSDALREVINKIEYTKLNGTKQEGYNATILPLVSDLYLAARENGVIKTPAQLETAQKAEILVRSLAKVGITALVDEATGYQYDREKDELQKILKAYIAEELLPWQKRFPDIYYKELFRLNGWDFTVTGIKRRPGVIGKWTNTLIYEQLPNGILAELKRKTPKSEVGNKTARYHQFLTLDVGEPNLSAQINQVMAIFRISDTMSEMWQNFKKMNNRKSGLLEIPFNFDEQGRTIEPIEIENLSDFDKSLVKALNYNPKED